MRVSFLLLLLCLSFSSFSQWTNLNTGISDNLNDVYFRNDNIGVVAGNKGIYYTLNGGNGAASWTRFSPANSTDNALYNRCKFFKIAPDPGTFKNYICGYDTVNMKAVIFYFKTDDQTYSFIYTGASNTALYDIKWTTEAAYAVGTGGLLVKYTFSSSSAYVYPSVTTKTFRCLAFDQFSSSPIVIAGDSIVVRADLNSTTLSSIVTVPLNYIITSMQVESPYIYAIGPSGYYRATAIALAGISQLTSYEFGPLHATSMFRTALSGQVYVTTDHGIYKKFGDALEFQPSSSGYSLNSINIAYGSNTAYACGDNGILIKSATAGGATIPFVNASVSTGCKGDDIILTREPGGSGTNCIFQIYNSSNTQIYSSSTSCALSYTLGSWNNSGNFTARYIVSNGTFSDTTNFPIFIPDPPVINMPASVSDGILCKNEQVTVSVSNTSTGWNYILRKQGSSQVFGSGPGNGGTINFQSAFINSGGNYYIQVVSQTNGCKRDFTNIIPIMVEQTKSDLTSSKINIGAGEKTNFFPLSKDAQTYQWTFHQDASIVTSSTPAPQNIFYGSSGQKTVTLISISANGCRDTATLNGVFVYNTPNPEDVCFARKLDSSLANGQPFRHISPAHDDGFYLSSVGSPPLLNSRYGISKQLPSGSNALFAKYTTNGALQWLNYISHTTNYATANITSSVIDNSGNVYVVGGCNIAAWYHFNNGDSMRIAAAPGDIPSSHEKYNGFILKMDSTGKYLWHTVINDHSPIFQGYPVGAGPVSKIILKENNILVIGNFLAHLSYYRNGVGQQLYNLPNSVYPQDNQNEFIMKINPDGSLLWSGLFRNISTDLHKVADAGFDNSNNIYVTGYFDNSLTITDGSNSNPFTLNGNGSARVFGFIIKMNSSGVTQWKVQLDNPFGDVDLSSMAVDGNGNTYVTGSSSLQNASQYFNITNADGSVKRVSHAQFHLLKFNSNGIYTWGAGSRNSYYGSGTWLYLKGPDIFTTAWLTNNSQPYSPFSQFSLTSTDGNLYNFPIHQSEFFVARYDTSGALRSVVKSGENYLGRGNVAQGLFIDSKGNFIIGGTMHMYSGGNPNATLFGNPIINTTPGDGFFLKLSQSYCYSSALPVANAGADKTVCSGEPVMIGGSSAGYLYSWTSAPAGFTSSEINPVVSPHVTTTYYLSVINNTGIVSKDSVVVNVTGAIADAGPDKEICIGTSTTIGTAGITGTGYSWTSNPSGFTSSLANPIVNPSATITYYLEATNGGSCVGRDTVLVTVNAFPIANAGQDWTVCEGGGAIIGTPAIPGNTYSWAPGTGLNFPTGAQPAASPVATITYVLTVTNAAGCSSKDSVTITVIQLPTPNISAGGAVTFCQGASVVLNSSAPSGNQWYWNGSSIPGATGQSYTALQAGEYRVRNTNSNCTSAYSNIITITILQLPPQPAVFPGGPTTFCQGGSVTLTSSSSSGNQWYKDGIVISAATAQTYVANQSGIYTVRVYNGSCTSNPSTIITVIVNPIPATPIITGNTSFCQGSGTTLTSSAITGNQWYLNNNPVTSAIAQTYNVTQAGNYTVRSTLNGCTSNPSNGVNVTVTPLPVTPTITQSGSNLISSSITGNQWYFNGSLIAGATNSIYTPATAGLYTVKVTLSGCSSASSAPFNYVLTAINSPVLNAGLTIAPNPVTTQLLVTYRGNATRLSIVVMDITGKKIMETTFSNTCIVDMSQYAAGTYLIRIINERSGDHVQRLIMKK